MLNSIDESSVALKAEVPSTTEEVTYGVADLPVTVIQPRKGWQLLDLREMWQHRELLYFFTWRDVKVRYKQTLLGAAWAVIQPFMMMIVFTVFLGKMAGVDSGKFPYPVYVYAGLLPWTFFSTGITNAGNSVVGANNIITKIYFPRLIIPFASVGAAVIDFLIAFTMLLALMLYYKIAFTWSLLLLPLLVVITGFAALGVGTILAALNVSYRDFKYTIPFLVQLWMFATPSIYMEVQESHLWHGGDEREVAAREAGIEDPERSKTDIIVDTIKPLLALNPMTSVVAFFRAATLGGPLPWHRLAYSTATIVVIFVSALFYFRRIESRFADII